MDSDRQLRSTIRAPVGYGESGGESPTSTLLMSMHLARERSVSADSKIRPLQSPTSLRRRVTITNRPVIVEFDPTLPPAAFPTLSEPRPRDRTASQNRPNGIQSPVVVDWISSNCGSNPTHTRNMAAMGAAGANGINMADNLSISDSDDEPVDDQEALGRKVSPISPPAYLKKTTENYSLVETSMLTMLDEILCPVWGDLKPAVQLEIVTSLLKTDNWQSVCSKLDLNKDDRRKVAHYLDTRNQQISREDRALAQMREKQLAHLMNTDQSILRDNEVPHQLVLRRISKQMHNRIIEMGKPELQFCQAVDILAARQFLRRRHLRDDLAGEWGSPMVELASIRQIENRDLPERFQWKDDWALPANCFISPHGPIRDCAPGPSFAGMASFTKSMCSQGGPYTTINPRDTFRDDNDQSFENWAEYIPFYLREEFQKAHKKVRDCVRMEMASPRNISELTRVRVGPRREARISLAFRDQTFEEMLRVAREREYRKERQRQPHVALSLIEEDDGGTPSKPPKNTQGYPRLHDEPLTRSMGGCWSLNKIHPSVSQSRYERQIEEARLDHEEGKQRPQTMFTETEPAWDQTSPKYLDDFPVEASSGNSHASFSEYFINDLPDLGETFTRYPTVENANGWIEPSWPDQQAMDDFLAQYINPDA